MRLCEAIRLRMINLIKSNNISVNKICDKSFMTTSTLSSYLNSKDVFCSTRTLGKFCQGIGITIKEFFNDPLFDNIEEETIQHNLCDVKI